MSNVSPSAVENSSTTAATTTTGASSPSSSSSTSDDTDNNQITLQICPITTGCQQFQFQTNKNATVNELKSAVARQLKLTKEQIILLWKQNKLESYAAGVADASQSSCSSISTTLNSIGLESGSTLHLIPNIETGLVAHRCTINPITNPSAAAADIESTTVLEALNTLSSQQITEFLIGRSPLNLTMRFGENLMLIQLQLSKIQQQKKKDMANESQQAICTTSTANAQLEENKTDKKIDKKETREIPKDELAGAYKSSISPTPSTSKAQPPSPKLTNLTEASRNLTETLKKLSSTVKLSQQQLQEQELLSQAKTNDTDDKPQSLPKLLQHHGKGVYSGTFSGTLNPLLQDTETGQPIESITTIVHILNDLLDCTLLKGNKDEEGKNSSTNGSESSDTRKRKQSSEEFEDEESDESESTEKRLKPSADEDESNKVLRQKLEELKQKLSKLRERKEKKC